MDRRCTTRTGESQSRAGEAYVSQCPEEFRQLQPAASDLLNDTAGGGVGREELPRKAQHAHIAMISIINRRMNCARLKRA